MEFSIDMSLVIFIAMGLSGFLLGHRMLKRSVLAFSDFERAFIEQVPKLPKVHEFPVNICRGLTVRRKLPRPESDSGSDEEEPSFLVSGFLTIHTRRKPNVFMDTTDCIRSGSRTHLLLSGCA